MNKLTRSLMVIGLMVLSAVHAMADCRLVGFVFSGGVALSGAMVVSSPLNVSGFTNSNGRYSLYVETQQNYTVTAFKGTLSPTTSLTVSASHGIDTTVPNLTLSAGGGGGGTYTISDFKVYDVSPPTFLAGVTLFGAGAPKNLGIGDGGIFVTLAAGGNYTLSTQKSGYTFQPTQIVFNSLSQNKTGVSFTGTASGGSSYQVSGAVVDTLNVALAGVTLSVTGQGPMILPGNGAFDLTLTGGVNYTLTASKGGFTFVPPQFAFTPLNGVQSGLKFTGTASGGSSYQVSGTVVDTMNVGLTGVTLLVTGQSPMILASNGYFDLTLTGGLPYSLTASKGGYTFLPPQIVFAPLSGIQSGLKFTGTASGGGGSQYQVVVNVVDGTNTAISGVNISVQVTTNNGVNSSQVTNEGGTVTYSLTGGSEYGYMIRPSKTGLIFAPEYIYFMSGQLNANQNLKVTGTASGGGGSYLISGTIRNSLNQGVPGITLRVNGGNGAFITEVTVTNSNGAYNTTAVLSGGIDYVLTPLGGTFAPSNYQFPNLSANFSNKDFTMSGNGGGQSQYLMNGNVVDSSGYGLPGVSLYVTGGTTLGMKTDWTGMFNFTLSAGAPYHVTPSRLGYTFTPNELYVPNLNANTFNLKLTGTVSGQGGGVTYQVSGHVNNSANGYPLLGVTIIVDGTPLQVVDNSGSYMFNLSGNVSHTLLASKGGVTFTPAAGIPLMNLSSNMYNQNFLGTLSGGGGGDATYLLNGKVVNNYNIGIEGITLWVSGGTNSNVTTDSAGFYNLTLGSGLTYTLAPVKANMTFTPSQLVFVSLNANQTGLWFTGNESLGGGGTIYRVSGNVRDGAYNNNLPGVTIMADGMPVRFTDGFGNYSLSLVGNTSHVLSAGQPGFTFAPVTISIGNLTGDLFNQNFSGTLSGGGSGGYTGGGNLSYQVSGTVVDAYNVGVPGVVLSVAGGIATSTVTGQDGGFTFWLGGGGYYMISPTKASLAFSPYNIGLPGLASHQTNLKFTATALESGSSNYVVTGRVVDGYNLGIQGVTLSISEGASAATTSDAAGYYSFTLAAGANYRLSATKLSMVFQPYDKFYYYLSSNQTGQNFVGSVMGAGGYYSGGYVPGGGAPAYTYYQVGGLVVDPFGVGIGGVNVNAYAAGKGFNMSKMTTREGAFSFSLSGNDSYSLTVNGLGLNYQPAQVTVSTLSSNQSGFLFTGSSSGSTLGGGSEGGSFLVSGTVVDKANVTLSGVRLSAVPMNGGAASVQTTTESGIFNFSLSAVSSYKIVPFKLSMNFEPRDMFVLQDFSNMKFTGTAYTGVNASGNYTGGGYIGGGTSLPNYTTGGNYIPTGGNLVGGGGGAGPGYTGGISYTGAGFTGSNNPPVGGNTYGGGYSSMGGTSLATVYFLPGGNDGKCGVTVTPSSDVGVSAIGTWNIVFTLPTGVSLAANGGVKVDMPWGWSSPQITNAAGEGYVTASNSAGVSSSLKVEYRTVKIKMNASLAAGASITIVYGDTVAAPDGAAKASSYSGSSYFYAFSDANGDEAFMQVSGAIPRINVIGAANALRFVTQNPSVSVNALSTTLMINSVSGDLPANLAQDVTVTLIAGTQDRNTYQFTPVTTGTFYADSLGVTPITTLVMLSGSGRAMCFYQDSQAGKKKIQASSQLSPASMEISVLSGSGMSGVSIDTGVKGTLTTVTLTPDNDGVADRAYINFTTEQEGNYVVVVDTNGTNGFQVNTTYSPTANDDWTYTGYASKDYVTGQIMSQRVSFEGRDQRFQALSNGTYRVQIALGGWQWDVQTYQSQFVLSGVQSTALSVAIQSVGLAGTVYGLSGGSAVTLVGAEVSAGGPSHGMSTSNGNGGYTIGGLRGGDYWVNVKKTGYAQSSQKITVAGSGTTPLNITLSQGSGLRVVAVRPSSTYMMDTWANVNAFDKQKGSNGFGSVHFPMWPAMAGYQNQPQGSTLADNGRFPGDSAFANYTELGLASGVWDVRLESRGGALGVSSWSASNGQSGSSENIQGLTLSTGTMTLTFNLGKAASIKGTITLTEGIPTYGTSVSIWAKKQGSSDHKDTYYSGVYLTGVGSKDYEISGIAPGTYVVKARVEGFVEAEAQGSPVTISGSLDVTGVNFASFGTGGKITGTFELKGNTNVQTQNVWLGVSSRSGASSQGFAGGASGTFLNISDSLPQAFTIGGLGAGEYEMNVFVSGYELDPIVGGNGRVVTVGSSSSTVNISMSMSPYGGKIRGTVNLGQGGVDFAGVQILANQLSGGSGSSGVTLSSAQYEITGLGTGAYMVTAFYRGTLETHPFYSKMVRVVNGDPTDLNIDLSGQTQTISGKVTTYSTDSKWNTIVNMTTNAQRDPSGKSFARVQAIPLNALGEGGGLGSDFSSANSAVGFFGEIVPDGADPTVGTYVIKGLASGGYKVTVPTTLTQSGSLAPDVLVTSESVVVKTASVSLVNLEISDGNKVSGSVVLASAESEPVYALINLVSRKQGGTPRYAQVALDPGVTSQDFEFTKLASGTYVLQVWTDRFSVTSKTVVVDKADVSNQVISLSKGATIKLQLKDADSNTILTNDNVGQYLGGVRMYAQANPWVEGGYREATRAGLGGFGSGNYSLDNSGSFNIANVPTGIYDVVIKADQYSFTGGGQGGSKNYAPVFIGGVVISEEEVTNVSAKDLGMIDLSRGSQVSGSVRDTQGRPLANILVGAKPSNKGSRHGNSITRTNTKGEFSLLGLDEDGQFYTIIAAPRGQAYQEFNLQDQLTSGNKYGEARKDDVDIQKTKTGIDFKLVVANGALQGKVYTADSGAMYPGGPVGEQASQPGAVIYLQDPAKFSTSDPLGNIVIFTDADGSFTLDGLAPGAYTYRILGKGYTMAKGEVKVNAGAPTGLLEVTLVKGGKVIGTIRKPDGVSQPNTDEVQSVVAVTPDFSQIVYGTTDSDPTTQLVAGYTIEGLSPGTTYMVIVFPKSEQDGPPDNMIEGGTVSVTGAGDEQTLNIAYRPTAPTFISQFQKIGNSMVLKFFSTQAIRNLTTNDKDATKLMTLVSGSGVLTGHAMSADRRILTVTYTPSAGEVKFTVNVSAYSNTKDVTTNDYFLANEDFEFFIGFDGQGAEKVSNLLGGEVKIAGDQSKCVFGQGAFSSGLTSKVKVELYKVATTASGAPKFAPGAYPIQSYKRFAKAPTLSGVFSNYYDVFLKTGNLAAGKSYSLALAYDASVTDTTNLNVYYLDETSNAWKKEETSRSVDTSNRTISVALNHASRFVVVNSSATTIGGTAYTGTDFTVFNFPNPFDLSSKTVTLSKAAGGSTATITGTEIRYTLPSTMTGDVSFQFYNLAGEKVRTITETNKTGGFYYYVEWDGKNDDGSEVASGVYLCVAKANGATKTFKLAVVK